MLLPATTGSGTGKHTRDAPWSGAAVRACVRAPVGVCASHQSAGDGCCAAAHRERVSRRYHVSERLNACLPGPSSPHLCTPHGGRVRLVQVVSQLL